MTAAVACICSALFSECCGSKFTLDCPKFGSNMDGNIFFNTLTPVAHKWNVLCLINPFLRYPSMDLLTKLGGFCLI